MKRYHKILVGCIMLIAASAHTQVDILDGGTIVPNQTHVNYFGFSAVCLEGENGLLSLISSDDGEAGSHRTSLIYAIPLQLS